MKIFKTHQVKEADDYTIKNEPIASTDLMERAASRATDWIMQDFGFLDNFLIFSGVGNNGGDGLVIARKLIEQKKNVKIFIVEFSKNYSEDFKINLKKLKDLKAKITVIDNLKKLPEIGKDDVIIDAIFGSGLSRPATGIAADVITEINKSDKKILISIDIPSGLFGEENHHLEKQTIIKADVTLTFEFPFLSFFFAENHTYVGEFVIIPIGLHKEFIKKAETNYSVLENEDIGSKIKEPDKFAHKGNFGHGLLLAGGYGRMGAAVLSAKAAHRMGIGLLTAHLPQKCVDIMQVSSPETLISIDPDKKNISKLPDLSKFTAIGIGPAIGFDEKTILAIKDLFKNHKDKKFVIDADAITIIGQNKNILKLIPQNSILTPHPKEFERLAGKTKNNFQRLQLQRDFSKKHKVIIVLKGAYTSVSFPDGKTFFNPTGNPGMATAGSGDVLTGIILSLLAQGYSPEDAALVGVYIHGLAGDVANDDLNYLSIIASDLIAYLDSAIDEVLSYC